MFSINDCIVYARTGVCKIVDIRKEKFGGHENMTYYVMQPVHSKQSVVYSPVGRNLEKFREIMTIDEVNDLIRAMPDEKTIWIVNDQDRNEKFSEILKEGSQRDLVKLIKTMYFHRDNQLLIGKRLHVSDERIMKDAERILYDEFAYVLNIKPDEVLLFISGDLDLTAAQGNGEAKTLKAV